MNMQMLNFKICTFVQGVLEAIRISCAGYPTRRTFYEFLLRFGLLAPEVLEGKQVLFYLGYLEEYDLECI